MASVDIVARLKLRADQFKAEQDKAFGGFEARAKAAGNAVKNVIGGALAGIGVAEFGRKYLELADQSKQMTAQIKLATREFGTFAQGQQDVTRIAAVTRNGLAATTTLYGSFVRASGEMGKSQGDAARATETFAKALKIGGADTNAAASATLQFGQALASGVLRGDEFNSITEASPRVLKLLSDSLNVSVGSLRAMAADGKLTSDVLYRALTDRKFTAGIDAEFKQLPVTFGESMTMVNDAAVKTFGAFDRGSGFSTMLADFVGDGTDGFASIGSSATEAGVEIRAAMEGLDDVFSPMLAGAREAFGIMSQESTSLRNDIASWFGAYDAAVNLDDRFANWGNRKKHELLGTELDQRVLSDTKGKFLRSYDADANLRRSRIADEDFGARFGFGAGGAAGWLDGKNNPTSRSDKKTSGGKPKKKGGGSGSKKDDQLVRFSSPVDGPVTSGFGRRVRPTAHASAYHPAVDYGVPIGTSVRAPADGVVIRTGKMTGFGNVVWIDHGAGTISQFNHLSAALVKPGDQVSRGETFAKSGNSGTTTGPHLDYRIKTAQGYVDPRGGRFKASFGDASSDAADAQVQASDAAAKKRESDAEAAAKALVDAQKRLNDAFGQGNDEVKLALHLGDMRAKGQQREADYEEAIARLRAQYLPQIAKLDAAGAEAARAKLVVLEAETRALVAQGHAVEDKRNLEDFDKKAAAYREKAAEEARRLWDEQADRQRESVSDLADFFENAFDSGGKSIWDSFKDQGKRVLAEMAAQWALSLISGQQQIGGNVLSSINGGGTGGIMSLFGGLFGGGGGGGARSGGSGGVFVPGMSGDMSQPWFQRAIGTVGIGPQVTPGPTWGQPGHEGPIPGQEPGPFGAVAGGNPMGGLMMNGALGSMTSGIAKSLGLKQSNIGATLGGALGGTLGSALGPIGGMVGSALGGLLGGTIGGLFKKTKTGSATLGFDSYGGLGVTSTKGNNADRKGATSDALGGVSDSLSRIAEQLGGSLGGNPSVSIGIRKDSYKVDTTGKGRTKGSGVLDFGKDQEAAIRAALSDALKDGVVQGISDASKRILQSGQQLEKAIEKAAMIEDIPRRLKARLDPVGAAIDALNKGWDKAIAALREGGASTEQMADAQKLYAMELQDTKASAGEATASLKAFRDSLNAGSASPLSLRDQEAAAEAALKPFLDQIAAGARIDQGRYQEAAQAYLDIERQLNGSGSAYFAAFDQIQSATGRAIATIDYTTPIRPASDPFAEKTASATTATADILSGQSQQLATIQGLLHGILDNMGSGGGFIGTTRNFVKAA